MSSGDGAKNNMLVKCKSLVSNGEGLGTLH